MSPQRTIAGVSGPFVVSGYLALSRLPGSAQGLDHRVSLLAALLAAELGGCQWCIDRCRHDCRKAGIAGKPMVTERERAALGFVEAVARSASCGGQVDEKVLNQARRFFAEVELAELTAIMEDHHCLESATFNRGQS